MCELSFLTGKKGEISAYLLAFNADALKVSTKTRSCPTNTLYLGGGGGGLGLTVDGFQEKMFLNQP